MKFVSPAAIWSGETDRFFCISPVGRVSHRPASRSGVAQAQRSFLQNTPFGQSRVPRERGIVELRLCVFRPRLDQSTCRFWEDGSVRNDREASEDSLPPRPFRGAEVE